MTVNNTETDFEADPFTIQCNTIPLATFLPTFGQERNEGARGAQCPGRRITGGAEKLQQCRVLSSVHYIYSQTSFFRSIFPIYVKR